MTSLTDKHFMQQALALAEHGRFSVSPNPMVGCVIVKDHHIVGTGYHERAGEAHAEIHALKAAGALAKDATMYVTLEPCHHHGRTPPCTEAIIKAGIQKVVIACQDKNPLVEGVGIKALQAANIEVALGVLQEEAEQLNEIFFHAITTQTPFVIAKWAMSLDGKTITHPTDHRQLSGEQAHQHTHTLRQTVDAIMIGAHTAIQDNPKLTARIEPIAKQPIRIIVSSTGDLPLSLHVLTDQQAKTIIATTDAISQKMRDVYTEKSISVLTIQKNANNQVDLPDLMKVIYKNGITSVLVEGGMTLHANLFADNLVNKTYVYIAPILIGAEKKKKNIKVKQMEILGQDVMVSFNKKDMSYV